MHGAWWARRRRRPTERRLEALEQSGERVGFRRWQVGQQPGQALAERRPRRAEREDAVIRQPERLPAPVVDEPVAGHEPRRLQRGEELRDSRRGDGRPPRELGTDDLAFTDRLKRQVLRDREGRIVARENALDPPADEGGGADERLGGLATVGVVTRTRH